MTNANSKAPSIPLPSHWNDTVRSAVLHVISLAQFAIAHTRGWAANNPNARIRLKAGKDRSDQDNQLLHEASRIKDARMSRIDPHHRPQYSPSERMAILDKTMSGTWT